jgi:hypothetical protein
LRQALKVAEAVLEKTALDLLANVSWQHGYYVLNVAASVADSRCDRGASAHQ